MVFVMMTQHRDIKIDLRHREKYEATIKAILEYGFKVKEAVFEYLPDALTAPYIRVRELYQQEIVRSRGKLDYTSILQLYSNIPKIEEFLRYLLFTTVVFTGVNDLRNEILYRVLARNYGLIESLIMNPNYDAVNDVALKLKDDYEREGGKVGDVRMLINSISSFIYGMRKLQGAYKSTLLRWIPRFKTMMELEKSLMMFYPEKATERRLRSIRTFIRWVSHETNAPIAIGVLQRGEYRKYTMIADMYSTLTTIRSGAFLAVKRDSVLGIINKIAEGKTMGSATLRINDVKGIVRATGRLSGDPIVFERGAFKIGKEYCSKLKCDECPLKEVCVGFTWVKVK